MKKNKTIYLKDYKVPNYMVEKLDLEFDLFDDETIVTSKAIFYKNIESKDNNTLELNGLELELISVLIDGKKCDNYREEEGLLVLENMGDRFELEIKTRIHPETNTALEGLYMSEGKFTTQCEPHGFRRMTYYLDRPDVMTIFTTKISADKKKYPVLLSNGNLEDSGNLENGRHFVVWEDPFKKPDYLFALVAGDLEYIEDHFTTMTGRDITLRIFTESHNIPKCDYAMQSLKRAMKWDEDRFGLEYDLDMFMIVAVDDFNSGAMENKGLNIFNSSLVFATPESATDMDYIYIERVIGHEYFHNWTGDRVTCRDWFQLSLKEGLTVYRDSEFTADMQSRSVKRIEDVRYLRDYQFREDSGPMSHSIRPASFEEINNFYTVTVYEKGAEVIRMYQTILGRDGFRKGMDLYFERHDGQAVTTEDFLCAMSDANDIDLSQFQVWYDQNTTPVVEVESEYNIENKTYTLNFKQILSSGKIPFIIPVKFGLYYEDGTEIKLDNDLIILTGVQESFTYENIESKPIPSLLRDFSAPVILNYDYSDSHLLKLMKYDSDDFNRFEASQKYALNILLDIVNNGNKEISDDFVGAFESILSNDNLDNGLKSEAISLPSVNYTSSIIGKNINPTLIFESREYFMNYLSNKLEDKFLEVYNNLNNNRGYEISSKDIADRKLKNTILNYLSYLNKSDLVYSQYKSSNNMTDTMASISCLSNMECRERDIALNNFYVKWKDDNNVMNKWFSIQARSKLDDTLEKIKLLEKHDGFDIKNPNKTRSLFSAFAMGNVNGFHKEDGSGYKFIADKVIELNKLNPQISSRLAKSLIDWKSLEPNRAKKLKGELKRISREDNLTPELAEVIERGLEC